MITVMNDYRYNKYYITKRIVCFFFHFNRVEVIINELQLFYTFMATEKM